VDRSRIVVITRDPRKGMNMTCGSKLSVREARYPVQDYSIPGVPNRSRVQNRPGIVSLGYRFPGLGVQGSFRSTSASLGFVLDFSLFHW
jgi:hypothetical protein